LTWIEAIFLGIIQGLTEFLPISSSGHLVLFQHLLGWTEPELLFDICVHVGTLAAVIVVFFKDLVLLLKTLMRMPTLLHSAGGFKRLLAENIEVRLMALIVMGSIPTAILGGLFAGVAEQIFSNVSLVGITLLITGTFLWLTRLPKGQGRSIAGMGWHHGLLIGLAQGMAITPGISRSGATIAVALFLGIDRQTAFRFSFLLSIPAIFGAFVLGLDGENFTGSTPVGLILAGSLSAAVIGFIALKVLSRIVISGWFYCFAPYCWLVGAIALVLSIFQ
jgi:undecaprenyl-diphosphatase